MLFFFMQKTAYAMRISDWSSDVCTAPVTTAPAVIATATEGWRIHFAPKPELFASGNDPLLILRELRQLGDAKIVCDDTGLPAFAELDAERCHPAWTIDRKSTRLNSSH